MPSIVLTEHDREFYEVTEAVRDGSIHERDAELFFMEECGYSRDYARRLIAWLQA